MGTGRGTSQPLSAHRRKPSQTPLLGSLTQRCTLSQLPRLLHSSGLIHLVLVPQPSSSRRWPNSPLTSPSGRTALRPSPGTHLGRPTGTGTYLHAQVTNPSTISLPRTFLLAKYPHIFIHHCCDVAITEAYSFSHPSTLSPSK